jgi:TPP-dependent trihydroxycyclohexane-1,2-dione (THcHDO) dehydratase
MSKSIRLTVGQALVRFIAMQYVERAGDAPFGTGCHQELARKAAGQNLRDHRMSNAYQPF